MTAADPRPAAVDPPAADSSDQAPHLGIVGFLRTVIPYFRPYRGAAMVIVACMLIDLAYSTVVPIVFSWLIDRAIVPHDTRMLGIILAGLAAGAVVATASSFVQDIAYARVGISVMNEIRLVVFTHLQRLSMGFYSRTQVGDIMSRFSSDLASVENGIIYYLPQVLSSVGGFVISVGLLFTIDWRLALISVAGLMLSFRLAKRLEARANDLNYRLKEETGAVSVVLQENLTAQPVVKGFNLQQLATQRFQARLATMRDVAVRANWASYFMARIPNVGSILMGFATLGLGAYFVFEGEMSLGELVAFYALFGQVSAAVTGITYSMPSLLEGAAGMSRVKELLDEPITVEDGPDPGSLPPLAAQIELERIQFGYAAGRTNLDGVSLVIAKGSYVAFVGASGSGKSTILNLITRFYDPGQGAVRFDGRDLREVTAAAVRDQIGIVFQDNVLFDTTIRENIRMGRLTASDAEIEVAARNADLHDVIMAMPDGYATMVGERGSRLSGGQRQRVAIARALVREPSVLVLDEATSALDPQTEGAVNETIRRLAVGRTVLSVTHRLAPVVHCDRVFVLDHGKVVEHGSHDELLARDGAYARLWNKQHGITVSDDGETAEITPARMAAVPLFAALEPELLAELATRMRSDRAEVGQVLIREGDSGDRFYVVARGRLEVLKQTGGGHQEQVDILDDGDYFGEITLLRDVPRTATVRALSPVVYLSLKREQLMHLVARVPGLRERLDAVVQARLDENAAVVRGAAGVVDDAPAS